MSWKSKFNTKRNSRTNMKIDTVEWKMRYANLFWNESPINGNTTPLTASKYPGEFDDI